MKAWKIIALVLLVFFLCISLAAFGPLFSANMTALNPNYIVSRADDLDLSQIVQEAFDQQADKGELPPEMTDEFITDLVDTVDRLEPVLKDSLDTAVHSVYDYLLARKEDPELAQTLRDTFLDPEFVAAFLDEIDIPTLVADMDLSSFVLGFLEEQSSGELPAEIEYLTGYVDEILIELGPWLKEQAAIVTDPLFDYLLGLSPDLDVTISMTPVKDALGDSLKADFMASPPQDLAGLSSEQLEQYFDEHFGQLAGDFPTALEFDTSVMADARADIAESLTEVENAFSESQQYIGYFKLTYTLLVVFMLLLVAGIILVHRRVKTASLTLACVFLTFGFIDLIGALVSRARIRPLLEQAEDITPALRDWIANTTSSAMTPMLVLGIVLLVLGGALLAVYLIYDRRERAIPSSPYTPADEDQPLT
jgi:flagellar basal body-associated protein FliL